jgi:2-oxoglutarate dehydrogenase E2 component (dihydrolipoamide succinyltransferase)
MATVDLVMPKMGESIMEATITAWSKGVGDEVEQDETILEIATDKVDSEVPSPVDGKIAEVLYNEGDTVAVGEVIARIESTEESGGDDSGAGAPAAASEPAPAGQPAAAASQPEPAASPAAATSTASAGSQPTNGGYSAGQGAEKMAAVQGGVQGADPNLAGLLLDQPQTGRFYSPLVMSIARTEGISNEELERIPGTGKEGRVTKKDILQYVEQKQAAGVNGPVQPAAQQAAPQQAAPAQPAAQPQPAQQQPAQAPAQQPAAQGGQPQTTTPGEQGKGTLRFQPAPSAGIQVAPKTYSYTGEYEIQEMDRMRKLIAENMTVSKHVSPHVTSFVEADVTNIVAWRKKKKEAFEQKYGEKLTYTPIFLQALAKTLRDFPGVNVSVDGTNVIYKKDINISLAVALPNGNLIVPTIKHADELNIAGLARHTNDLTQRARENKLQPEELADGTYTLSNVGTFGNVSGTPIILQPQVAVMAVGAIRKKPAVIESEQGDLIGVRHMMMLSHSYDHRVVDGMLGGQFVRRMADYLEAWDPEESV